MAREAVEMATGSVARAARLVDALSRAPEGLSLAQLVGVSAFSKSTAFRVLAALQEAAWVYQEPDSRVWRLGAKLAEIGRRAARIDVAALAAPGMDRLARLSEDTVFLSIPEGAAAICVARRVGSFPIRTLTLDRGDRRPLGVGAGALALYCSLPQATRAAVCRINEGWLAEYGFSAARLEAEVAVFARRGHALNAGGVVPGMSAVAVPVRSADGRPLAALAIGAIDERMGAGRIGTVLLPALREEAARLGCALKVGGSGETAG